MVLEKQQPACLRLQLYIQPKASRDKIVGHHNQAYKITITAPPVEGQANRHLIAFLSKQFAVPKKHVLIEKGQQGRYKQVCIIDPQRIPPELLPLHPTTDPTD